MTKIPKLNHLARHYSLQCLVARDLELEQSAWETGFYQRSPKKLTASGLILGFWQMQQKAKNSLRNWALESGLHQGHNICKQSLCERLNEKAVQLVKHILSTALKGKFCRKWKAQLSGKVEPLLARFNRILIHDSTTQKLPSHLHEFFSGSYSHGDPAALLRLQALFDLSQEQWLDFSVDTYRQNDQSQALFPLDKMHQNDLLIRDLGYFTLDALEQISQRHYLITKWDNQSSMWDQAGQKINLMDLLNGQQQVDLSIQLGAKKRLPFRLIARKLPKAKAQERIRKARKERHSRANHNEQYYQLLEYEIFLTNVPKAYLTAKQVAQLYALRWYIEILFKSWKSYANFRQILEQNRMSYHRTLVTIFLLLIQFVYFTQDIYQYIQRKVSQATRDRSISMLKYMDLINSLCSSLIHVQELEQLDRWIPQFIRHATYEKRSDRQNMKEKYLYFKELRIREV